MASQHGSVPNDIPKWLLEFDKFAKTHQDNNNNNGSTHNSTLVSRQARPLTEDPNWKKPKWFEDLTIQRRRLSEAPRLELHEPSPIGEVEFHFQKVSSKVSLSDSDSTEASVAEYTTNYVGDRKLSTEFRFLDREYLISPNGGCSSRDGSSKSSIFSDTDILEGELMSFSTMRSLEKIKLQDVPELEDCIIPEIPAGSQLVLRLLDNWGDDQFIGLNGIEIIDPDGNRPKVQNVYIRDSSDNKYESADLNRLVDNINRTHDDTHIWQHRLQRGALPLQIIIDFKQPVRLALLRIWNYNKSRIHSFRGVKNIQLRLDDVLIFSGEIAKASGELLGSLESFGDTILFTTDEEILDEISKSDAAFQELMFY